MERLDIHIGELSEKSTNWITQKFSEILDFAESLFGIRNKEWTYLGLKFIEGGPFIFYDNPVNKKLSIVLSKNVIHSMSVHPQFIFQLSHEIAHFLHPAFGFQANNLNEGISSFFSVLCQKRYFPELDYAITSLKGGKYYEPYLAFKEMYELDPNIVKKLKLKTQILEELTIEDIRLHCPKLSEEKVNYLLKPF